MSNIIRCDECGSEMLADDFLACHHCYFKLVRENRELERHIERINSAGKTAPNHSAEASRNILTREGCVRDQGGAQNINSDDLVYTGPSFKGFLDGTASVPEGSGGPSGKSKGGV